MITSAFGFIAAANCLLGERLIPRFVDIDPETYQMDLNQVEAAVTPRTRAILAVELFGQPADHDRLEEIGRRHGLLVVVDACESLGAEYKRRRASSYGIAAVLSFSAGSPIFTGEGGAVVTDERKIAELCRSMSDQGRGVSADEALYERLCYNYRLADLNSALGLAQLERVEEILEIREQAAERYHSLLDGWNRFCHLCLAPETTRMSWFAYPVRLTDEFGCEGPARITQRLENQGITLLKDWSAIPLEPLYRRLFGFRPGMYPAAERASERSLAFPVEAHVVDGAVTELRAAIETIPLTALRMYVAT